MNWKKVVEALRKYADEIESLVYPVYAHDFEKQKRLDEQAFLLRCLADSVEAGIDK